MDNIEVSAGVNGMSPTEVSVSAATHTVVSGNLHVAIDDHRSHQYIQRKHS